MMRSVLEGWGRGQDAGRGATIGTMTSLRESSDSIGPSALEPTKNEPVDVNASQTA